MLFDLLIQFLVELLRALLIDALSERVCRRIAAAVEGRRARHKVAFYHGLINRHQKQRLHKLLTDADGNASK